MLRGRLLSASRIFTLFMSRGLKPGGRMMDNAGSKRATRPAALSSATAEALFILPDDAQAAANQTGISRQPRAAASRKNFVALCFDMTNLVFLKIRQRYRQVKSENAKAALGSEQDEPQLLSMTCGR